MPEARGRIRKAGSRRAAVLIAAHAAYSCRVVNVIAEQALLDAVRRLATKTARGGPAAELAAAVADELIGLLDADASAVFRFDGD